MPDLVSLCINTKTGAVYPFDEKIADLAHIRVEKVERSRVAGVVKKLMDNGGTSMPKGLIVPEDWSPDMPAPAMQSRFNKPRKDELIKLNDTAKSLSAKAASAPSMDEIIGE